MTNTLNIPTANGGLPVGNQDPNKPIAVDLDFSPGTSTVIVGANGSGKTRLGSHIEAMLDARCHRIPAQRSIKMPDNVMLLDYDASLQHLRVGHINKGGGNRIGYRWGGDPAITPLDDFEHLVRALFAQKNRVLSDDHELRKIGGNTSPPVTKLDVLTRIWVSVLPHRELIIRDAQIKIKPPPNLPGEGGDDPYSPTQLSDGERVIFYLIGQCLLAPDNGVVIIDEPELHIHPAISDPLWDALERERADCAFLYLTHDIDFAVNRVTAKKYFVRSIYRNSFWDIEPIPEDTGLPEQLVIELVGNRKPVLFVEGDAGSIDSLIYRSAYPDKKIEPRGGCDNVIHSVASFRANAALHRLGSVFGCIDADQRTESQIEQLKAKKVFSLPVAEIENIFLLPSVFLALSSALSFPPPEANQKLEIMKDKIFTKAAEEAENVTLRYVSRQIDNMLKRITVDRRDTATLLATYAAEVGAIDPAGLIAQFKIKFETAIPSKNYELVLQMFDQKGLLDIAAGLLGLKSAKDLVQQTSRFIMDANHISFKQALIRSLPVIA